MSEVIGKKSKKLIGWFLGGGIILIFFGILPFLILLFILGSDFLFQEDMIWIAPLGGGMPLIIAGLIGIFLGLRVLCLPNDLIKMDSHNLYLNKKELPFREILEVTSHRTLGRTNASGNIIIRTKTSLYKQTFVEDTYKVTDKISERIKEEERWR
ncbi:MAG: hypothetical protein LBN07_03030 [Christensenellaceae bacterium]|jgi:hypothetical protein|nr:hypothetical protein [Christensenellaceae bacterium]